LLDGAQFSGRAQRAHGLPAQRPGRKARHHLERFMKLQNL
jgi:hypothetical protein